MKKIFFLTILPLSFIFQSCSTPDKKINISTTDESQIDTAEGSCPYLTLDNKGNIVLSWIKKTDSTSNIFCYAVSTDKGKTFGETIEIPGSNNVKPHGENMPKILFKPSGAIIAVWGASNPNPKNAYSGAVFYSQSFDEGKTWSTVERLVRDSAGIDQRYFDMILLPNGEAGIVWLDNRKKIKTPGSALFFAETNGSSGFQNERMISEPCCECCRTQLFIDSKKNIHVVYRAILNDSIRDMVHTVSVDDGKTFSNPKKISNDNWVINGCPHTGPAMSENKEGMQFSWFTGGQNAGVYYCNSKDNGKTFSQREMVSGSASKHCQITSISNDQIAIVWNENMDVKNASASRVGIEIRNANGINPVKQFITAENAMATFPVIKSLDENSAIVAFTQSVGNRDYVKYKIVGL